MIDLVAGVDIGGTNIAVALVDENGAVVERGRRKTPRKGPERVVRAIAELLGGLDGRVTAVGVGSPGLVRDGVVMFAPNLEGWSQPVPLEEMVGEAVGVPVVVDNDANVGALGEWAGGAGRGARHLLGVWLGTGVGGGLVLDGKPYRGAFGGAGELGHMIVQRGGALCGCGRRGCVEAYAGRAALEAAAAASLEAGRPTALADIQERRGKKRMTAAVWAEALAEGDALASRLLGDAVEALGCGIASAINLLDLDTVVIGGGLADKLGQTLVDQVEAATSPRVLLPGDRRFALAELGDDAGVIGAAALARDLLP